MPLIDVSHDDLYQTAALLAETVPEGAHERVRTTLEYLYHSGEAVTPKTLQHACATKLSRREAKYIVYHLSGEGILTEDAIDARTLRLVFSCAALLATEEEPPENTLVATIPHEDHALHGIDIPSLVGGVKRVIKAANDRLIILSPFLSGGGFARLRSALHTAAKRESDIILITRSLTYGDEDYNREFARKLLTDDYCESVTTVYEYFDGDETTTRPEHQTTFHAKVVLADDHTAYMGSANITQTGLFNNLELGVVFCDVTVAQFDALIGQMLDSQWLSEVTYEGGEFETA